ncbi:alpha/beta hydrolase [Eremomyces bilateralis CBS 781.70]|uniref:Alpha/beta hydrolase n=1 Tax=Eremomyces bilateralis CBS 781.70 TaxID=1392243 RepID=A0A6G1FVX5_9PEZI|nr:alpha/beta hydrolase [Eremomyces bilateralis CBS 781.70]KAF1809842.1 alpha/beta hydrolase [Eremomyces bilateralis CBS 781.70]
MKLPLSAPSTSRLLSTSRVIDFNGKENLTITLADGRTLGYAEYGLSTGYPLFFLHGFPSSRLETYPLDRLALRRGIRIIAPDRPGFGLSTAQPDRRITDWPADVAALADSLHISRFAVLGCSGGGPYALACARYLTRPMVSAVGVFAGAPPWAAGPHYMSWYRRVIAWAAVYTPGTFAAATSTCIGLLRWLVKKRPIMRWIDASLEKRRSKEGKEEEEFGLGEDVQLSIAETRERMVRLLLEGFKQGSTTFVHEARLLSDADWGFQLEKVDYNPVRIWHGLKDANAPIEAIRYMAKRLPHSNLTELENTTHYTMAKYFSQALNDLVPEEELERHNVKT